MSPPQIVSLPSDTLDPENVQQKGLPADQASIGMDEKKLDMPPYREDAFGDEEFAEVKYKVLKWW